MRERHADHVRGGKQPVVLAPPRDREGVRPLRVRVEVVGAESAGVGGAQPLAVRCRREAIDTVGVPQAVQILKPRAQQPIVVVLHSRNVRQVVGTHFAIARDPLECEGEPLLDLHVGEMNSELL